MKGFFPLALVSILVALGSPATAGMISFSDTFGPVAPAPAAPLATLSLFDPALGTLTKVTLTLDANSVGGSITYDNESPAESILLLGIGSEVTAVGLAGVTAVAVPLTVVAPITVDADNDGAADFVGTDSFTVFGAAASDSGTGMLAAGLGPYIGLGTFDVSVAVAIEAFLALNTGFGPLDPQPGDTDGTVTVTYEFTPIPEPGTFALLASALLTLGFPAWRRRSCA